jgi:adenosine deaminase
VLECISDFVRDTDGAMSAYLILSVDRRNTLGQAMEAVDLAIEFKSQGVVAVDLCGNPFKGNVTHFRPAFEKARAAGLKITLHFAEVLESSTEIELQTLLSYNPDRLGHVVHVPEDIAEQIVQRNIGLELCLSCNIKAKLTKGGYQDHHFGFWRQHSCPVILCVSLHCLLNVANMARLMMSASLAVQYQMNTSSQRSISTCPKSSCLT